MRREPELEPAFPTQVELEVGDWRRELLPGMRLRDYFAAKALVSMHVEVWHWREDMSAFNEYAANAAQTAYAIADAMLAERSK